MYSDKIFQIALVVSLTVHTALLIRLPYINFLAQHKEIKKAEVTYIMEKTKLPSLKFYEKIFPKKPSLQISSKVLAPAPNVKNEQIFKRAKITPIKKPEPEIITVKKKITLPAIRDDKMVNPVYLNYYQIIRERIKHAAYQNYTRLINGEVYVSFIVLSAGQLNNVRINNEKSTSQAYLKDIAKKTIHDASPFPSFPQDLNYPELTFNVIISFEVE